MLELLLLWCLSLSISTWGRSYISSVAHETGRGMKMRKIQQLVHIKKFLGKTCDIFKIFNVLHSSSWWISCSLCGHFSLSFEKLFSEILRFYPAIIAGKKPKILHYFMYLSTLLFILKENHEISHLEFFKMLIYCNPRKGKLLVF